MNAVKCAWQFISDYYEKLLLGVMLLLLSATFIYGVNLLQQMPEIGNHDPRTKVAVPTFHPDEFDQSIEINLNEYWTALPEARHFEQEELLGLSDNKRKIVSRDGEGTLFDPALYSYSSHDQQHLVHLSTIINPFTGKPEEQTTPPFTCYDPCDHLAYRLGPQPILPFWVVNISETDPINIKKWRIQIEIPSSRKQHFLTIGKNVGKYRITAIGMDPERKEKFVTVKDGIHTIILWEGDKSPVPFGDRPILIGEKENPASAKKLPNGHKFSIKMNDELGESHTVPCTYQLEENTPILYFEDCKGKLSKTQIPFYP